MTTSEKVLHLLTEACSIPVTEDTILSYLPLDSLDQVEVECTLEHMFNFQAYTIQWVELWRDQRNTVNSLIRFINSKI